MPKPINNTPCHCLKLRRSAGNIADFYDRTLAPSGVTVGQYALLHTISRHSGCNVRELSEITLLERSTLARNLKPMIRAGLILDQKEPGARDSRLVLSEQGEQTRHQAGKLWLQAQDRYEKILGPEKLAALEEALAVLQNL